MTLFIVISVPLAHDCTGARLSPVPRGFPLRGGAASKSGGADDRSLPANSFAHKRMTTPGALPLRPRRFASLCACLRPLVVWRPSTSASLKRFAHRRGGVEPPDTRLWVKSSPANVIGTAMTVSEGWKKHPNTRRLTFSAAASTCLLRAAVALCPPLHETQNR